MDIRYKQHTSFEYHTKRIPFLIKKNYNGVLHVISWNAKKVINPPSVWVFVCVCISKRLWFVFEKRRIIRLVGGCQVKRSITTGSKLICKKKSRIIYGRAS